MEDVFRAADGHGTGDTWRERVGGLRECLERLPETMKEVCRLHYFRGLTAKGIGSRIGAKLGTVLKRLERARKLLRECIERRLGLGKVEGRD